MNDSTSENPADLPGLNTADAEPVAKKPAAKKKTKVKELVEKASLLEHLEEIGNSRTQYLLFSRYMEALVAYRKFYGGHDE